MKNKCVQDNELPIYIYVFSFLFSLKKVSGILAFFDLQRGSSQKPYFLIYIFFFDLQNDNYAISNIFYTRLLFSFSFFFKIKSTHFFSIIHTLKSFIHFTIIILPFSLHSLSILPCFFQFKCHESINTTRLFLYFCIKRELSMEGSV